MIVAAGSQNDRTSEKFDRMVLQGKSLILFVFTLIQNCSTDKQIQKNLCTYNPGNKKKLNLHTSCI